MAAVRVGTRGARAQLALGCLLLPGAVLGQAAPQPPCVATGTSAGATPHRDSVHATLGLAGGYCWREDATVGGAGGCLEVSGGAEVRLSSRLRVGGEVGAALAFDSATAGDPNFVATSSGGPAYGVVRVFLGVDWTHFFLVDVGLQERATSALGSLALGTQGLLELGTRPWRHVQLGVRSTLGVDGIRTTGTSPHWSGVPALGTEAFVRWVVP